MLNALKIEYRYKTGDTVRYFVRSVKDSGIVASGIGIIISVDSEFGFVNVLTEAGSMHAFYACDLMNVEKPIEQDKTERSS